jgi:four helix bundle protein
MATIRRFEDLEIWQIARKLCQDIYPLTFKEPISKDFRYKDQIRGTCGAIMDNIAEGFGRGSKLEFINSLTTAKGEAEELKSQLYRGFDISYFSQLTFSELYRDADMLVRKTGSFINYLNRSMIKGQKFKERN